LIGLVRRSKADDRDNAPDLWSATTLLRALWPSSAPVPPGRETEMSGGVLSHGAEAGAPISSESAREEESLSHESTSLNGRHPRCTSCRHLLPPNYAAAGLWLCPACEPAEDEVSAW